MPASPSDDVLSTVPYLIDSCVEKRVRVAEPTLSNLWPMEFITDWSLHYRSEQQMIAWTAGLDPAGVWTDTETTGRVRLLYVRKR